MRRSGPPRPPRRRPPRTCVVAPRTGGADRDRTRSKSLKPVLRLSVVAVRRQSVLSSEIDQLFDRQVLRLPPRAVPGNHERLVRSSSHTRKDASARSISSDSPRVIPPMRRRRAPSHQGGRRSRIVHEASFRSLSQARANGDESHRLRPRNTSRAAHCTKVVLRLRSRAVSEDGDLEIVRTLSCPSPFSSRPPA